MKLRIASLTLLCLALAAIPASASTLYSNGPINGTTDAWTINFGFVVSDTFTLSGASTVTGFDFGVWEFAGDHMTSIDYSITSAEFGGTVYGSGTISGANLTDTYISANQYGYNIDKITAGGLNLNLAAGTYWLNLQNAVVPSGDPVFWDENSGKGGGGSKASENSVGTIASEAFDICGSGGCGTTTTTTTPEPSSIMLFGSGILGLAGVLRRKLF